MSSVARSAASLPPGLATAFVRIIANMRPTQGPVKSDAEAVREFTRGAGQPTPETPQPMTPVEVEFISKSMPDPRIVGSLYTSGGDDLLVPALAREISALVLSNTLLAQRSSTTAKVLRKRLKDLCQDTDAHRPARARERMPNAVILDEVMELMATTFPPEVAKAKLKAMIDESKVRSGCPH